MAVIDQLVTEHYAIYNSDCIEVMLSLPNECIHFSIYSPPFGGLYCYSSDPSDLSNCDDYDQFFKHYDFVVEQVSRLTMPGRLSAVHCMDIPTGNTGTDALVDFPGDIIRQHKRFGFNYCGRYLIWKEPLAVRNKTMAKNLAHKSIVEDSADCANAQPDYLLLFRKTGKNPVPITHPVGLLDYAGSSLMPADLLPLRGMKGNQIHNSYSHWIWRQYASPVWMDVRLDRMLPFKDSREADDEKHVHPMPLDINDRAITLWSNPGEKVLTPFMGVGSEVYSAVQLGRKGIGIELKSSYYKQAVLNCRSANVPKVETQQQLF